MLQVKLLCWYRKFQAQQQFIVVKDFSADCLVGADFLVTHKVYRRARKLHLGDAKGHSMQFTLHKSVSSLNESISAAHTVEVRVRSVLLIQGKANSAVTGLWECW